MEVPLSPAAGITYMSLKRVSRKMRPFITLFRPTPPAITKCSALDFSSRTRHILSAQSSSTRCAAAATSSWCFCMGRSEEHTSELQSRGHLVCRLLLEKKKKKDKTNTLLQTDTHCY